MIQHQKNIDLRESINKKLIFSSQEICRLLQITPETLKDWENEFPLFFAGQTASGKQIYRQKDVLIILRIKELLEENTLTTAGIKRKIEEEFGFKTDQIPPERLYSVLAKIKEELIEILKTLEKKQKKG
ncbi:MAG: MerR family transcriptional regulator [Acidobacteriota bacterium]|nr:MerR family transcriptional regulator [Acidobacteriota bacterium]MDW3228673.1 MerR family transcriptional regulator [Acidobacteriota bacterium]MDY0231044.1 MerR family transcriptional regulator [Candidatus Saccharicenans sp.]